MYRVELKVLTFLLVLMTYTSVPNVPCGVESTVAPHRLKQPQPVFLMYRVELKAGFGFLSQV